MIAVSFAFSLIQTFIIYMAGYDPSLVDGLDDIDLSAYYLFYIFVSATMFVGTSLLMFLILKIKPYELISYMPAKISKAIPLIMFALGGCLAGNIFSNLVSEFFKNFGYTPVIPELQLPMGVVGIILYFVASCAIPALCEEFMFRGLILGSLRKYGDVIAIVLSSLLFALMHGNFVQIPFAFIVGLIFGYITVLSNSIWPAVAAHFLNNFFSCALDYLTINMSIEQTNNTFLLYMAFLLVVGIAGLIIVVSMRKKFNPVNNHSSTGLTSGQRISRIFFAPVMLLSLT